jgi:hypothetical protein
MVLLLLVQMQALVSVPLVLPQPACLMLGHVAAGAAVGVSVAEAAVDTVRVTGTTKSGLAIDEASSTATQTATWKLQCTAK